MRACGQLAAALMSFLCCAPALAAGTISISVTQPNGNEFTMVHDCPEGDVCRLPTNESATIPYPDVTASATLDSRDGVLRGRMRLDGEVVVEPGRPQAPHEVLLRGVSSFSVMGHAELIGGSANVSVDLSGIFMNLNSTMHNNARAGVQACVSAECQNQIVQQKVISTLTRGTGEVVDVHESFNTVVAGRGANPESDDQETRDFEFTDPATLRMPFEGTFGLSWEFETELLLYMNGARGRYFVENDFSNTVGFTGLSFHDADGNDVTNMFRVSFDSPLAFIDNTAPVPEPETWAMLLAGLGALGFTARRRKQLEAG